MIRADSRRRENRGRLENRVAIVTGSTRGIGRAIAEGFAAEGATVVVNSRDPEAARTAAAEIAGSTLGVGADVAPEEGCEELIARTIAELGRIDVLVNNAGASVACPSEDLPLSDWQRMVDLNLTGPFICCQRAARHMLAASGGVIINVTSIAAFTTPPRRVAYVSAKAGLVAMTKALAAEWSPRIRVNALVPGYVETDLVAELMDTGVVDRSTLEARTPYGRLGRPQELAHAAIFLASDEAEYVSGITLPVDGGWLVYGQNL
jgi:NAD(P)-dependent dehydrogenase (short-subunit alcohol dehydrogenase family)